MRTSLFVFALASCVTNSSVSISGSASIAVGMSDGAGTVVSDPPGLDCKLTSGARTGACSASFADYTVVTLTATPASHSTFGGWVNLASGTDFDYEEKLGFASQGILLTNPLPINVDKDRTLAVLASFTAMP